MNPYIVQLQVIARKISEKKEFEPFFLEMILLIPTEFSNEIINN